MSRRRSGGLDDVAAAIASAFLDGPWQPDSMATRAAGAIDDHHEDWLRELAVEQVRAFGHRPADAPRELIDVVRHSRILLDRWYGRRRGEWIDDEDDDDVEDEDGDEGDDEPREVGWTGGALHRPLVATEMGPSRWPVPPYDTTADLADALGLRPAHLEWYADVRSLERTVGAEPLRHYSYRWLPKRTGGARLLEAPKPMLKLFQRRVLHEILDPIPVHDAAHGFRRGRSIHTFVAPHVGRAVVVRIDLEAFFSSVRAGRVNAILRTAGYPEPVAHRLTGLVTNAVPHAVLRAGPPPLPHRIDAHRRAEQHLRHPHLPQGAPTSPALANLAAHGLDRRLTGLAHAFDARYTRYADDLAFSGGRQLPRSLPALIAMVTKIVRAEGFRVNATKTRVATTSERQMLGGLVVNERPNLDRRASDRLKAILHDAITNGPAAANREEHPDLRAHLLGRIAWVEASNPARATKLRATFDRITW